MNFSTPYLIYILGAYSLTLCGLCAFLWMTLIQWKKSKKLNQGHSHKVRK